MPRPTFEDLMSLYESNPLFAIAQMLSMIISGQDASGAAFDLSAGADAGDGLLHGALITAANSAAALPATPCKTVFIQNFKASAGNMLVGVESAPSVELVPGQGISFDVSDASQVFFKRQVNGEAVAGGWAAVS